MILKPKRKGQLGLLLVCLGCWTATLAQAPANSTGGHVYLTGEVHKEGAVEIASGETMTVTQAIIADGGLTDFADLRHITTILRKNSDGTSQVIHVDWYKIMGGAVAGSNLPGDIIVVPKRLVNF